MRFLTLFLLATLLAACASIPQPAAPLRPAAAGSPGSAPPRPVPDFLASCAAAVAQKIFLIKPSERESATDLYTGVGRYMRLSCVASSPEYARARYEFEREQQCTKAEADTRAWGGDLNCIAGINEEIDVRLRHCLAYQRENAPLIAHLASENRGQCTGDKLQ